MDKQVGSNIKRLVFYESRFFVDNRHTLNYIFEMTKTPIYQFDPEKNAKLIASRGISFEEVIAALGTDKLLDIVTHPNIKKYPNQKMYVLELKNYIYLVPFVENQNEIFLKTIFASRQATKRLLKSNEVIHEQENKN